MSTNKVIYFNEDEMFATKTLNTSLDTTTNKENIYSHHGGKKKHHAIEEEDKTHEEEDKTHEEEDIEEEEDKTYEEEEDVEEVDDKNHKEENVEEVNDTTHEEYDIDNQEYISANSKKVDVDDDEDDDSNSSSSSLCTERLLSLDPMYIRLTKFLYTNDKKRNITEVLEGIENKLEVLITLLVQQVKK